MPKGAVMLNKNKRTIHKSKILNVNAAKKVTIGIICLCIFLFGPHFTATDDISLGPKVVSADDDKKDDGDRNDDRDDDRDDDRG